MSFVARLASGIEDLGVRVHRFRVVPSVSPRGFLAQGIALRTKARDVGADLVVAQFGNYTGLLVSLFARHPVVVTYRGSDLNPEPNTNRLLWLAQQCASQVASLFADGTVCVSANLARRLLVRKRATVIPSPTDLDAFRPMDQGECRAVLGWPPDACIALFFVGSNAKVKGLDLARAVQRELIARRSRVTLRLVEEMMPISRMPSYLNAADCLLFLSRFEGSPNLVREACACNLPVVTTPCGDLREVLRDVTPGRIVARDVTQIADALEATCRTGVRSNGREHVCQYATPVIARRAVEFYDEIVRRYTGDGPADQPS